MTRSKELTVGADIEVFVCKAEPPPKKTTRKTQSSNQIWSTNTLEFEQVIRKTVRSKKKESPIQTASQIIPCVGIFPGTKQKPHQPKGWPKGYAVQEDNVMLEFNIPPASSANTFNQIMQHAHKLVNGLCHKKDLKAVWSVSEYQFKPIDLTSDQAKMFACDPDLNAYTGGVQRDSIPDFGRFRTCGGHIHMGGDFQCPDFVAVLFLELVLTMYFGQQFVINPKSQRAKWYGRPGIYREKEYGIEYRTLSNGWASSVYSVSDISRVLFTLGNVLISTPANVLQQWFRRIEWTLLHDHLSAIPPTGKESSVKQKEWQNRFNTLHHQYTSLKIPGF